MRAVSILFPPRRMKNKKLLIFIACVLFIVVTGVLFIRWFAGTGSQAQQPSYPEGSIRWQVHQARSEGEASLTVFSDVNYNGPNDIGEAIASSTLLVAQLAATWISWDETTGEITTWHKFTISESLVQRPYEPCQNCTPVTPPAGLQPINTGELVIGIPGGSAIIDDVVVEEMVSGFPGLVIGQRYLLFLNFDPARNIGDLNYGPTGVLLISTQNTFMPVAEFLEGEGDEISSGLAAQYGNSLTQLRSALNPSVCNQSQRQNCIDEGGTWNDTNCTCQPAFDPCIKKPWLCE